jgi:hypothetical protein
MDATTQRFVAWEANGVRNTPKSKNCADMKTAPI